MKKLLLVLAAAFVSMTAMAQPGPMHDRDHRMVQHRKHKVWVPTHREHGRIVRGHYVWR